MKKAKVCYAMAVLSVVSLCGCSGMKMVEADAQGGLIKYRRHGIGKDSRHAEALARADAQCKRNGYTTYTIEREFDDGRFHNIRFSCRK